MTKLLVPEIFCTYREVLAIKENARYVRQIFEKVESNRKVDSPF